MRYLTFDEFGGPEVLRVGETEAAEVRPHEVRVRVEASAVNPIDLSHRAGRLHAAGMVSETTGGMGWDVAGTVTEVGASAAAFAVGDPVVGLRDELFSPGAHAESVVLPEAAVAAAPQGWSPTAAATLPLNGLTALEALERSGVTAGDSLLVTGAAGGVGGFVVELAALRGVRVVGVARPADEDWLRDRGAGEVVTDVKELGPRVRSVVPGGVDAVVDTAVLGAPAHEALRGGGRFVVLVRPFAPLPVRGTEVVVAEVRADGRRLSGLVSLAERGLLSARVAEELPLEDAARAHVLVESGGARGRVVLRPAG